MDFRLRSSLTVALAKVEKLRRTKESQLSDNGCAVSVRAESRTQRELKNHRKLTHCSRLRSN